MRRMIAAGIVALATSATAYASEVSAVCFTPDQDCTSLVVREVSRADTEILVQAYSFTSRRISDALAAAQERGVRVRVIVDGSELRRGSRGDSQAPWLVRHGVPVMVDTPPGGIAHSKVMIIDGREVITGSFNFTRQARRNAENIVIIDGEDVARAYRSNFIERARAAQPF